MFWSAACRGENDDDDDAVVVVGCCCCCYCRLVCPVDALVGTTYHFDVCLEGVTMVTVAKTMIATTTSFRCTLACLLACFAQLGRGQGLRTLCQPLCSHRLLRIWTFPLNPQPCSLLAALTRLPPQIELHPPLPKTGSTRSQYSVCSSVSLLSLYRRHTGPPGEKFPFSSERIRGRRTGSGLVTSAGLCSEVT